MKPIASLALLCVALTAGAQTRTPANLPVVHPKITTLGTIQDMSMAAGQFIWDAGLSPNGRLIAFGLAGREPTPTFLSELHIWDTQTHKMSEAFTRGVNTSTWGPKGDMLAVKKSEPRTRGAMVWIVKVDPTTGKSVAPPRRVGLSPATYAARISPDEKFVAYPSDDGSEMNRLMVVSARTWNFKNT